MDRSTQARIRARMRELGENPFDPRLSKPLVGLPGVRSSRVGGWRILYTVIKPQNSVLIANIRSRGEAYKKLR